ncbi:hypothetical protein [Devosia sp. YR412]|uniref:hypothetical protein n=1 Tax=Devosia sp. YR412 TaxID=1881030 RepID=UPI0014810E70|nr:hypothetical protein [Devosia sp. YR412]
MTLASALRMVSDGSVLKRKLVQLDGVDLGFDDEKNERQAIGATMALEINDFKKTAIATYGMARDYIGKTSERKWTAVGIALAFGMALIFMPGFGIAVFGGAFSAWGLGVVVITIFGGLVGNRAGLEVERRRRAAEEKQ